MNAPAEITTPRGAGMSISGYIAPQTEDEQSEEDREALDQYDGPDEIDPHYLPDGYGEADKA